MSAFRCRDEVLDHEQLDDPLVGWALVGWALVIKGSLHLVVPSLAQRTLKIVDGEDAARRIRLGGIIMLPLGLAIGWIALCGLR